MQTFFCRMQKSDGGENMFLPSFMRQQSRVSCFYYWVYNIVWNTCFGPLQDLLAYIG